MNEYETRKNKIEIKKELNKCSKKLLIKIIVERCIGRLFNNLTNEQIKLALNRTKTILDNYLIKNLNCHITDDIEI